MRSVNKSRVPEPKPQNKISFLFVAFFLVVLAAIGISAWAYLENNRQPRPANATAEAEISKPVVKEAEAPPAEAAPAAENAVPASKEKAATETPPATLEKSPAEAAEAPSKEMPEKAAKPVEETEQAAAPQPEVPKEPEEKGKATGQSAAPTVGVTEQKTEQPPAPAKIVEEKKPAEVVIKEPPTPPASESREDSGPAGIPAPAPEEKEPMAKVMPESAKAPAETAAAQTTAPASPEQKPEEAAAPPKVTLEMTTPATKPAKPDEAPKASEKASAPEPPMASATVPEAPKEAVEPAKETPAAVTAAIIPPEPLWKQNAMPFTDPENRPRIALVISEMGMSRSLTETAIKDLPPAVTLAFNPYGRDLQPLVDEARKAGHEVLLQLPMEPFGYPKINPGPEALLAKLSEKENLTRLGWTLDRITGYAGLTNQMGSRFTASADLIRPVLKVLKSKGLLYLDSKTASNSVAGSIAKELSIPVAINNRFLDHQANGTTIDARLNDLERIAKQSGAAVGIGYPHPLTYNHMEKWIKSLPEKGFVLAPISALVNRQDIK